MGLGAGGGGGVDGMLSFGCHSNPVISFPTATSPITLIHAFVSFISFYFTVENPAWGASGAAARYPC